MKKSKLLRSLSMLIAALMALSTLATLPVTAAAEDPVEIGTAEALIQLAEDLNNGTKASNITVKLTADIDLTDETWTPINTFKGTFDGQGHTIKGLTIECSTANHAMFLRLDGATVKNLRLIGSVEQTVAVGSVALLAVTAGDDTRTKNDNKVTTTIENVYVSGTLNVVNNNASYFATGFVSYVEAGTTLNITGCASAITIVGGGKDNAGFVGAAEYGSAINLTDCVFYGYIPEASKAASGAFLGHIEADVTMTRCLDLGFGAEKDNSSSAYRGVFMYLAFNNYPGGNGSNCPDDPTGKKGTDSRETADVNPSIVLEDCYVTMNTTKTGLFGYNGNNSKSKYNITIKYTDVSTPVTGKDPADITKTEVRALAYGTTNDFETVYPNFTNWVVTNKTVQYGTAATQTIPLVLPRGIFMMEMAQEADAEIFGNNQYIQLKQNTNDTTATDVRLVTSIDATEYDTVGYEVYTKYGFAKTTTNTVFTSIVAGNTIVEPDETGAYWLALGINGIPEADEDTEIFVRPYAVKDGNVTYGKASSFTLNDFDPQIQG